MTSDQIVLGIGIVISLVGLYLVYDFGGWQLLIAIFVLTWGNNISLKYGIKL